VKHQTFATVEVSIPEGGPTFVFHSVTAYPDLPAMQMDPPEAAWLDYNSLTLKDSPVDLTDLLAPHVRESLESNALNQIFGL
jgi:hypothetical protein